MVQDEKWSCPRRLHRATLIDMPKVQDPNNHSAAEPQPKNKTHHGDTEKTRETVAPRRRRDAEKNLTSMKICAKMRKFGISNMEDTGSPSCSFVNLCGESSWFSPCLRCLRGGFCFWVWF